VIVVVLPGSGVLPGIVELELPGVVAVLPVDIEPFGVVVVVEPIEPVAPGVVVPEPMVPWPVVVPPMVPLAPGVVGSVPMVPVVDPGVPGCAPGVPGCGEVAVPCEPPG
jgi:hypothetical protein